MQTITIDQLSEVKELTDADGIIVNQKNTSIANLGQIKEYIQEDLLDGAIEGVQDYIAQYMAGRNEWLPPVNTVVELKNKYTSANLDKKISYLCKVVADPIKSGVYQAVAGWTTAPDWLLYDDTVDFVNEDELEAKVTELRTEIDEQRGAINGIATLDEEGKVPTTQIPTIDGGLLAVTSDDTLKGNGTSTDPLGVNLGAFPHPNQIMYLTKNNAEKELAAKYGGTWAMIQEPAPRTLFWKGEKRFAGGANEMLAGLQFPLIPNIPAGRLLSVNICATGLYYPDTYAEAKLISSIRGDIQTLRINYGQSSNSFNTIQVLSEEIFAVVFLGIYTPSSARGGFNASSYDAITTTEYVYIRSDA